jgi:alcohol dehydrogenase (cytochrome c)
MKRRTLVVVSTLGSIVLAMLALSFGGPSPITALGLVLNSVRSVKNPPGTAVVELRAGASTTSAGTPTVADTPSGATDQPSDVGSWPSYNRTLTSQRYSPLSQINIQTVYGLRVLCSYDTHLRESFETGPLMVDRALIGTTAQDIFSIDPSNCRENWRMHEDSKPGFLRVNRGAAYLDGRLFRGTLDGRVLAYDFETGKRVWETTIADPKTGELVDAAPIAWNGLVFIGSALGDVKGVKGRVYALAADSGRIVWETYLVPKAPNDPTRGPQWAMPASVLVSWSNAPDVPISGGGIWTSYTLDSAGVRLLTFLRCAHGRTPSALGDALASVPQASASTARELFVALGADDTGLGAGIFDAVDIHWFDQPSTAERYLTSSEARKRQHQVADMVRGVERLIARVRVIV